MMKRLLFALFIAVWALQVRAAEDAHLFARIIPDRDVVYAGDSMLVVA